MESLLPVGGALLLALIFSLGANAVLFGLLRRKAKPPQPTLTAEELLHDLLGRGQAILRVEVIDPTNLILRSPRR